MANPPKITCMHNPDASIRVLDENDGGLCLLSVNRDTDQRVFVTLRGAELNQLEDAIAEIRARRGWTR